MYELIRGDDIVAEYYDIDFHIDNMSDDRVDELSHEFIRVLLEARNDASQQTISRKDFIVLSAHTPTKLSLHVVSKKTYFKNNKLQRIFALDVYKTISEEPGVLFNIDTSVYSNNRCFRMYLNHKYGKKNTLTLFYPSMYSYASFEDTWVVLTHQNISNREEIKKYSEDDLTIMQYHDAHETLTDDLEVLLREFMEKHPYLSVENNTSKHVNRINRIDDTTRPCLTDPSDNHSKENMYWYINKHHLYVGCFCKKGKHLCLGTRKGIHKVEKEPEPFHYGTHTSDDFKEYQDMGTFKTLYDKRRTGKGKTTCAMKYAETFERVLLIHHRLSPRCRLH